MYNMKWNLKRKITFMQIQSFNNWGVLSYESEGKNAKVFWNSKCKILNKMTFSYLYGSMVKGWTGFTGLTQLEFIHLFYFTCNWCFLFAQKKTISFSYFEGKQAELTENHLTICKLPTHLSMDGCRVSPHEPSHW